MSLSVLFKIPARTVLVLAGVLAICATAYAQGGRYIVIFPSTITTAPYAGDVDLFAAMFGGDATLAWTPEEPRPIATQKYREFAPSVEPDAVGGAWLAYTIEHTDTAFGGDQDILLRRIDRFGQNILGDSTSGVAIVAQSEFVESNPRVILSDAGVLVFYEVVDRSTGSLDIAAVKLDGLGKPIWPTGVWVAS